jgi:SAM-dependent methyltransferase
LSEVSDASRIDASMAVLQSGWLAPARARLLRRAAVARRRVILDLGAGCGSTLGELARRGAGVVIAADRAFDDLRRVPPSPGVHAVACDAARLPLASDSVDLVFAQWALLWMPLEAVLAECLRVLRPGGAFASLEPDFGGLMEEPKSVSTRELWLAALQRAGADPCVGRRIPVRLAALGLRVEVRLLDSVLPALPERFDVLGGLPLTGEERSQVEGARRADARLPEGDRLVHLPIFSTIARCPS